MGDHRAGGVVLAVAVAAALAACGDGNPLTQVSPSSTAGTPSPTPTVTRTPSLAPTAEQAACGPVERPPQQQGSHLIGDQEPPVPYSSTPPTSGWHSSGAVDVGIRDNSDPLTEPEQVSVLEADAVVITHRDLDEAERGALEELVRNEYEGRVAVTPYEELNPGQVAMTAWGVLQVCDGFEEEAVRAFVEEHATAEAATPGH